MKVFNLFFFFFSFWPCCTSCWILISRPEIKPVLTALGAQSFNHWTTRECPNHFELILDSGPISLFCIWLSFFSVPLIEETVLSLLCSLGCVWSAFAQAWLTLCSSVNCSPSGSSVEFSQQEYVRGLSFLPPGDLPSSAFEPVSLASPSLQMGSFTSELLGKHVVSYPLP